MTCTRAQTVTFLWRAVGSPEPRLKENPFYDVDKDAYFYKAILWAYEKGITSGTSKNIFSPNEICNEAQIITFLWRALNCPDSSGRSNLASMLGEHYYTDAVAWADTHGILSNLKGNFIPEVLVTRGKLVTYLYRSNALEY